MGIEPTTTRLKVGCSTAELPARKSSIEVCGLAIDFFSSMTLQQKMAFLSIKKQNFRNSQYQREVKNYQILIRNDLLELRLGLLLKLIIRQF